MYIFVFSPQTAILYQLWFWRWRNGQRKRTSVIHERIERWILFPGPLWSSTTCNVRYGVSAMSSVLHIRILINGCHKSVFVHVFASEYDIKYFDINIYIISLLKSHDNGGRKKKSWQCWMICLIFHSLFQWKGMFLSSNRWESVLFFQFLVTL